MLSGFVKSQYEELQSMLKAMGAEVTSQAKHATHLIMPKMCRTISFLCAMSYVKWILKPEWITDSHKEKKLIGMYQMPKSKIGKWFLILVILLASGRAMITKMKVFEHYY